MFSKNSGKTTIKTPTQISPPSIISADLKVIGNLNSRGEIQIDGKVKGDIHCKSMLVGKSAEISGSVVVERLEVHGKILGEIKAKVVKLAKSANVIGDILHEELAIETGAFLEGHCKHSEFKTNEDNDVSKNSNSKETLTVLSDSTTAHAADKTSDKIQIKSAVKI